MKLMFGALESSCIHSSMAGHHFNQKTLNKLIKKLSQASLRFQIRLQSQSHSDKS